MKVCFQADADLNQDIVQAMRRRVPAVDFQTAHEASLAGLADDLVLEKAAQEGRVLVSHDRRTMPFHFAALVATRARAGVILVPKNLPIRQLVCFLYRPLADYSVLLLVWLILADMNA